MGMSDLPDMYAQSPRAALCNTFLASCAQAKSSVELQQLYL